MILRRVIEHMKKQHWTAVLLDFLIVVIGVYLGLILNEVRQTRALEKSASMSLVQLRENLIKDLAKWESAKKAQQVRKDALQRVFEGLEQETPDYEKISADIALGLRNNLTLIARNNNFDAMQKRGELYVLPPDLRQKINATYAYDIPGLVKEGLALDSAQDGIVGLCLGNYWDWSSKRPIRTDKTDMARFRNCFASLYFKSDYYLGLLQGDRYERAKELEKALDKVTAKYRNKGK